MRQWQLLTPLMSLVPPASPRSSYHVSIPWPSPSILHKFSLVLLFFWTTISKSEKQGIRWACQKRKQAGTGSWPHTDFSSSGRHLQSFFCNQPLSLMPKCLTSSSRGCLDVFSIKVGDDGFTLLCGLHHKEQKRG